MYTHPEDTSLIDEIAVGEPAEAVKQGAATMVHDDWNVHYDDRFTLDPTRSQGLPETGEDGTVMEFGAVELGGCVDHSARTGTWGPDQAPVTFDPMSRLRVSVIVEYRPQTGTFMVTGAALEGGVATPC